MSTSNLTFGTETAQRRLWLAAHATFSYLLIIITTRSTYDLISQFGTFCLKWTLKWIKNYFSDHRMKQGYNIVAIYSQLQKWTNSKKNSPQLSFKNKNEVCNNHFSKSTAAKLRDGVMKILTNKNILQT